nr:hypothetical protein [Tanacetum cinerariifolium]
ECWNKPWEMTYGNGFELLGSISFKEDRVGVVWMEVGGRIVRARVVSRLVLGLVMKVMLVVLRGWEVFVRGCWVEELALEAMEYYDQGMGYEEGKVEVFSNGEAVEHVAQTRVRMVLVSSETYGIFTQDDFLFLEMCFQLGDNPLIRIKGELQHKDRTNIFIYIEKIIKPNSRESRAKVGLIIKKGGVDNVTFMDEMRYERLVDFSFMSGETSGSVIHRDVVSGIMMINVDGSRHSAPQENKTI